MNSQVENYVVRTKKFLLLHAMYTTVRFPYAANIKFASHMGIGFQNGSTSVCLFVS